jgi:hypothetical protein
MAPVLSEVDTVSVTAPVDVIEILIGLAGLVLTIHEGRAQIRHVSAQPLEVGRSVNAVVAGIFAFSFVIGCGYSALLHALAGSALARIGLSLGVMALAIQLLRARTKLNPIIAVVVVSTLGGSSLGMITTALL